MNFGRAALLGLSGGECDLSYPRCPRDENQVLYYLNNHRGGFFRFFNGGNSFGDDSALQHLNPQQQQQIAGTSQGLNMLALQALAETLGGATNGFNLNNLIGGQSQQQQTHHQPLPQHQHRPVQNYQGLQADQSQNTGFFSSMFKPNALTDVVSNLLTGVIGNRFSRRVSKRSVYENDNSDDASHRIQKRIVNLKENIGGSSVVFEEESPTEPPVVNDGNSYNRQPHQNTLYDELEKPFKFSNANRVNHINNIQQPESYALKFPHEIRNIESNQGNYITPSDVANRLRMLFPDVESFSEKFNQNLYRLIMNDRIGKILTNGQRPIDNYGSNINSNYYATNRYPVTQSSQYAGSTSNYNKQQSNNNNNEDRSHLVYVTNGQGQIEYVKNERTGEKTRYY
jgi:hypothetical protein